MKRFFTVLLAIILLLGTFAFIPVKACAEEPLFETSKIATKMGRKEGRFRITIQVKGEETIGSDSHSEIIVTEYISTRLTLNPDTIKVINENTSTTIWSNKYGWIITKNRPTSHEVPVVVERIPSNGNDISYKLTWYLKDGEMLQKYKYSLVYEVDINEDGFEYSTENPSTCCSMIEYIRENENSTTRKIESTDKCIIDYTVGENKVENGNPPTGDNIMAAVWTVIISGGVLLILLEMMRKNNWH